MLDKVRGAADLQVEVLSGAAQVQIDVDRARMARYGLNVSDVRELVETAIGGATATEILDGPRRFDVVVRFPDEVRGDPERLGQLLLTAPGGEKVPLASVADIRTIQGPEAVNHEGGQRRLVVQTNVRGRDVGSFVAEAQLKMASAVKLPAGTFVEWGGQFENQQRATRRLMVVVPASLAIIFLLLFLTFGRVRQAALVILNVPFALVGGIAALWLRGLNLNLSASVGFIALFGVAVLNGIVMIAAINRLREEGHLELRPVDPAGRGDAPQAGHDDGPRGRPRLRPDGPLARRGRRGPAPARQRRHRRHHDLDAADPDRPPDPLRAHRGLGAAAAGGGLRVGFVRSSRGHGRRDRPSGSPSCSS